MLKLESLVSTVGSSLIEVESVGLGVGLADHDGSVSDIRVAHEGQEDWEGHQEIVVWAGSLGTSSSVNDSGSNSVVLLDLLGLWEIRTVFLEITR